jgi:hypothetical protein
MHEGGLKISKAPGFGTTIAFFKWCAMAMAMAISVWHAYKPEKGVDPEFQQYSRGYTCMFTTKYFSTQFCIEHQFQRLSNGVEDPKLARSLMQVLKILRNWTLKITLSPGSNCPRGTG